MLQKFGFSTGPCKGLRRAAALIFAGLLLSGCATYRAMPITDESVRQSLAPPDREELQLRTASISHPILKPIPFDISNGLSPDEAAVLSVVLNPGLRAERDRKGIAGAEVLKAGIIPNPRLSYSVETPVGGDTSGKVNVYGVGLGWDIGTLISREARLDASRSHLASVELDVAWLEWQTAETAKLQLYRLVIAEETLALEKERKKVLESIYRLTARAVEVGVRTSGELPRARGELKDAQLRVIKANSEVETERLGLNRVVGLPPDFHVTPEKKTGFTLLGEIPSVRILAGEIEKRRHDLRALRFGYESEEASITGATEIAGADASGTFTTVAAFIPLVMLTGIAAIFLRPFGLTIGTALVVSLVLSLTLVPLLFSRTKTAITLREGFPGDRVIGVLKRSFQAALGFSLRHRMMVVIFSLMTLGLAGLTLFLGKASMLPPVDEGAILIEYIMPPGTSLKESNRIGETLDRIAMGDPDVYCVYRRNGSPETGYQVEGVNMGELLIKLKSRTRRNRSVGEITASLKRAYSGIKGMVFLYHQPTQEKIDESFSGLPALFGVTIYGTDLDKLTTLAKELEEILTRDPAISNVINNTKVRSSGVDVRLKNVSLARYGIEPAEVLATLRAARFGIEATRIIRQKGDVAVIVRLDAGRLSGPEDIRLLHVGGKNGVPLERVADISINRSPASITRLNGQREIPSSPR